MKKILFLLLAALLPAVAEAHDAKIDGIYYNFDNETKTASVTYHNYDGFNYESDYSGTVNIPASLNYHGDTYVVTQIEHYAFYNCWGLQLVTIPNSVTNIGDFAFYQCSCLTSVTIANCLTNIGGYAFYGCRDLTSIMIPESVKSIGVDAFAETGWYNKQPGGILYLDNWLLGYKDEKPTGDIVIVEGTRGIADYAFYDCSGLNSVLISDSVTSIGNSAFYDCISLNHITIPKNVTSIGERAFSGYCSSLTSVTAFPETPPFLYANSFSNYNIPLYASKTAIAAYQTKEPWSKFAQFLTLDGQEVEVPQCATPTIDYANWKLTFNCATKGAEIVSKAKVLEEKDGGSELSLTPTYTITAYAKAEGYRDSEVATATIGWKNGRPVIIQGFSNVSLSDYDPNCDTNLDGTVDVADIATIIDAMAAQAREQVDLEE